MPETTDPVREGARGWGWRRAAGPDRRGRGWCGAGEEGAPPDSRA